MLEKRIVAAAVERLRRNNVALLGLSAVVIMQINTHRRNRHGSSASTAMSLCVSICRSAFAPPWAPSLSGRNTFRRGCIEHTRPVRSARSAVLRERERGGGWRGIRGWVSLTSGRLRPGAAGTRGARAERLFDGIDASCALSPAPAASAAGAGPLPALQTGMSERPTDTDTDTGRERSDRVVEPGTLKLAFLRRPSGAPMGASRAVGRFRPYRDRACAPL